MTSLLFRILPTEVTFVKNISKCQIKLTNLITGNSETSLTFSIEINYE